MRGGISGNNGSDSIFGAANKDSHDGKYD